MRKILGFLILMFLIFAVTCRNRIYLRDPLGGFYLNGAKQDGTMVFINYSNDVLVVMNDHQQKYLIQQWDGHVPGKPEEMPCFQNIVCLARADHAPIESWSGARTALMTSREVTFIDENEKPVRIVLR